MSRLVFVSNRVAPIQEGEATAGGLAAGVLDALRQKGGVWFGWSGTVAERADDAPDTPLERQVGPISLFTIDLTRRLYDEFYRGFANGTLWPVLHYQIHGYLMADAAAYSDRGLGNTDFSIRRADINFQRKLWRDWLFYADSELVNWHLEFKDIYLRKQTRRFGVVTIGNQQEPFGLEQYGSFRNTTFLERATSSALAPSRSFTSSHSAASLSASSIRSSVSERLNFSKKLSAKATLLRIEVANGVGFWNTMPTRRRSRLRLYDRWSMFSPSTRISPVAYCSG